MNHDFHGSKIDFPDRTKNLFFGTDFGSIRSRLCTRLGTNRITPTHSNPSERASRAECSSVGSSPSPLFAAI